MNDTTFIWPPQYRHVIERVVAFAQIRREILPADLHLLIQTFHFHDGQFAEGEAESSSDFGDVIAHHRGGGTRRQMLARGGVHAASDPSSSSDMFNARAGRAAMARVGSRSGMGISW